MNVEQMIEALQKLPSNAMVVVRGVSGPCDDPFIELASPPQPFEVVRRTIASGPHAGEYYFEDPEARDTDDREIVYDISGWAAPVGRGIAR